MSLSELLVKKRPRETSGPRSSNRMDYQKSWGLTHLLELHESGQDYVIVFDYHDDILVLDSSHRPERIRFYQIKTKTDGRLWTANALIKQPRGKDGPLPSILGKLYSHQVDFGHHAEGMHFVSNAGFRLKVAGKASETHARVCLQELTHEELTAVRLALAAEHSCAPKRGWQSLMFLEVTDLSVQGHDEHVLGKLLAFLSKRYPGQKLPIAEFSRALFDEIRKRSNRERQPADFGELCKQKSLSRESFEAMLRDLKPSEDFLAFTNAVTQQLTSEGFGYQAWQIMRACQQYELERFSRTDVLLQRARSIVERAVQKAASGTTPRKLKLFLSQVETAVKPKLGDLIRVKSQTYLHAMILMALYDI